MTNIEKLREQNREALLEYLFAEPEYNMFIIGDTENCGFDSEHVEVFALRDCGAITCIALRFYNSWVIYSRDGDFDSRALADFLSAHGFEMISGKSDTVAAIAPYVKHTQLRMTRLARCREAHGFELNYGSALIRPMRAQEAEKIISFFCEIDEFRDDYIGKLEQRIEEKRAELASGSDSCFGVFDESGELISTAAIAARCSIGGMVVGVATRKDMRGRGLASAAVSAVCRDSLARGRGFVSIFYDNPVAASIYKKIGFEEIGDYAMLKA
ncbi:MAG: GNAT family N-acetyltransferase [Oscillospiraceae bacterium]